MGGCRSEQGEGLRGFAEAHFVGEDAPEFLAVQMPQPRDAELLVRTQHGREILRHGGGRQHGKVFQCGAAGVPGLGCGKVRGDRLQQVGDLGGPGLGDAMPALGAGGGDFPGEGALGGLQLRQPGGIDEIDGPVGFDVAAAGRNRRADLGVGRTAGLEAERDVVAIGLFTNHGGNLSGLQMDGVFFEVGGELGVQVVAQQRAVGGENIEHLVPVAQPPLAGERIEREAVGAEKFQRGIVNHRFARGQGDGEEMLGAVHGQRHVIVVNGGGFLFRFRRRFWRRHRRCGFDQVLSNPRQIDAVPGERVGGSVGAEENAFAEEGADQFAELGAFELNERHGLHWHAQALEEGEALDEIRRWRHCQVEFHPDGDGVARGGGGEVGREDEAKHRVSAK